MVITNKNKASKIIGKFSVKEIDNAFEESKPVEEIAEKVGINRPRVSQIVNKLNGHLYPFNFLFP